MLSFEREFHVCSSDKAGVRIQKGRKIADLDCGWILEYLINFIARFSLLLKWQDVCLHCFDVKILTLRLVYLK